MIYKIHMMKDINLVAVFSLRQLSPETDTVSFYSRQQ
jgi:hypothetical protein